MRRLEVLHVIDTLQIGGTEGQCLSIARGLDPKRFHCSLVCFNAGGPLSDMLGQRSVPFEVIPFHGFHQPSAIGGVVRLATHMRRQQVQLVQAYGYYSNIPAILAGRMARVPILVASRRDMGEFLTPIMRRVERWIFRLADRIVVNASAIHHKLIATGMIREGKAVVIPTGVDLDRFGRALPFCDKPEWAQKGKVIAMVAKFRRQKDQPTFLKAARRVLAVDPTITFVLAGGGYLRESVEQLARDLNISSSVWFVGDLVPEQIPGFFEHCDVAVLASKGNEGIPNVVLEAMAAGKPMVATDVGGCREAVENGVTGILVPPGDPASLADAILRLVQDDCEAERMSKAGRQRVESKFSMPVMIDRFSLLYTGLKREKIEGTKNHG